MFVGNIYITAVNQQVVGQQYHVKYFFMLGSIFGCFLFSFTWLLFVVTVSVS
jgi:hypothetical protein